MEGDWWCTLSNGLPGKTNKKQKNKTKIWHGFFCFKSIQSISTLLIWIANNFSILYCIFEKCWTVWTWDKWQIQSGMMTKPFYVLLLHNIILVWFYLCLVLPFPLLVMSTPQCLVIQNWNKLYILKQEIYQKTSF